MSNLIQESYPAGTATITISPQSVASSSDFTAGVESDYITNISNLDLDNQVFGFWTTGTTPTINTQVQGYVVPDLTDDLSSTFTWPDVFDGTASAETVTSPGVLQGCGYLAFVINVDSTTSNRIYPVKKFSVAALLGGWLPTRWVLFISHNTGATSNATSGNFLFGYQRIRAIIN